MKPMMKTFSGIVLIFVAFAVIAGLAFPSLSDSEHAGRSERRVNVDFPFLKNEKSQLILVYFGYVGCTSVCIPALDDLVQIHHALQNRGLKHIPDFWFINMTPQMDTLAVKSWVEHFDKQFKSYAPTVFELDSIVHTLDLVYTPMGIKAEHMPYLYLMRKKGESYELVYIYTSSPYNHQLIFKDIGELQ